MCAQYRVLFDPRYAAIACVLALASACLGSAMGGAAKGALESREGILFENDSPDMVRVSLYLNNQDLVLGRVAPLQRTALSLRARRPADSDVLCLVVVPIGTPGASKPGPMNPGATKSDFYPVSELTRQMWVYSGSLVMATRLPSDRTWMAH